MVESHTDKTAEASVSRVSESSRRRGPEQVGRVRAAVNGESPHNTSPFSAPRPHQSFMNAVFQNNPAAIIAINEQFQIRDLNPSGSAKLGVSCEEARQSSCKDLLKCRNSNGTLLCGTSNCPLTRVLEEKHAIPAEELFLGARPESTSEYSVSVVPAPIEADTGAVFIARDLS
ncbi:MAG TPA: PAS domain-containing protein, partial [Ktedonobacteraceae bacterium]|nr:PAS domain-containing protein [Ktedonobacteraceae bacterium]